MSDPRKSNLPWPFVYVDEPGYFGVEIAPNEIVYVVLAGDHRKLQADYLELREAAEETVKASNQLLDVWEHYGRQR